MIRYNYIAIYPGYIVCLYPFNNISCLYVWVPRKTHRKSLRPQMSKCTLKLKIHCKDMSVQLWGLRFNISIKYCLPFSWIILLVSCPALPTYLCKLGHHYLKSQPNVHCQIHWRSTSRRCWLNSTSLSCCSGENCSWEWRGRDAGTLPSCSTRGYIYFMKMPNPTSHCKNICGNIWELCWKIKIWTNVLSHI